MRFVLALVILLTACDSPAASTASAQPTANAADAPAHASPASAPGAALGPSSKYGVIALSRDGFVVRRETDPGPIRRIAPVSYRYLDSIAVSPDGRYVAYWVPDTSTNGDDLAVYDAVTNADPRTVLTLTNLIGGAIAWADDDSGLAYAAIRSTRGPLPAMFLSVVDLGGPNAGTPRLLPGAYADFGHVLKPLAWIRGSSFVAAVEATQEGRALSYVLASENTDAKRFALGSGDQIVRVTDVVADPQTRLLSYLVSFTCQDGTPGCTLVRFWALEDPQIAVGWQEPTFSALRSRPFTREVLIDTKTGVNRVVGRWTTSAFGSASTPPIPSDTSAFFVRPDGSALFAAGFDGRWRGKFLDLDRGTTADVDLTTDGGGAPTFSVVLDAAEASRIAALPREAPILSEGEARALVIKRAGGRIDHISSTLDRGTFPAAGTPPVWTVKTTGEFEIPIRGLVAPVSRTAKCVIWSLDARTGFVFGTRYELLDSACA